MRWNSEVSLPTTVCLILCVVNNIACFIFVVILLGLLSAYQQTTGAMLTGLLETVSPLPVI